MTKSTITREQLEEWVAQFNEDGGCDATDRQLEVLIRQSLAAMDQKPALHRYRRKAVEPYGPYPWHYEVFVDYPRPVEGIEDEYFYASPPVVTGFAVDGEPVAWLLSGGGAKNVVCFDSGNAYADPLREVTPLYRHAQQPVVPDERDKTVDADDHPLLWSFNEGWNACRAAMLQAQSDDDGEPTDDERIMAIEGIHNCERCGDEGWMVGEMGIMRCACGQTGNFRENSNSSTNNCREIPETSTNAPVIPDGYVMVPINPTGEMQTAGGVAVKCETTALNKLWTANKVYQAMLAAAPQPQNAPQNIPEIIPGWIPVSERMPDDNSDVLCTAEFDGPGDWRRKVGYWHEGKWVVYGASWTPTHWMPLPAGPKGVKGE